MEVPTSSSSTIILTRNEEQNDDRLSPQQEPSIKIKLKQSDNENSDKKVKFMEGTVDNEQLNRKKSKCCCIYEKPKKFDDPSSSEESDNGDDFCSDHCHGSKKYHHTKNKNDRKKI